jgi:alpha-tubulin suppressor-like RCC1 family protein
MKKFTSVLLAIVLMLVPFSALANVTFPLELHHEWAEFDMGVTHSAAINVGGIGYAWGYNYDGPIGNGVTASSNTYTPYNWGNGVTAVSTNGKTTLSIDENGVLYICGEFWFGIGGSTTIPSGGYVYTTPTQFATNVRSASMGFNHLVYVKNDNTLWVYGENGHGQIGDNSTTACYTAKQILTNVAYAVAGECLTAAVKTDGTLWVWGYNSDGQVGNSASGTDKKTPVQVLTNVFTVSTMGKHVCAIKNDGTLWAWGDNQYGQLGRGNTTDATSPVQVMTGVAQVSAGTFHTGVIKTDGTLWFCGNNYRGPFGNGTTSGYFAANSSFLQTAGTWVAVNCGEYTTAAVAPTGQLYVAGENTHGKLGVGESAGSSVPTLTPLDIWIFGDEQPAEYTVTFVDGLNGSVISTVTVLEGGAATAPAAPVHTGYTFIGWDRDFSNVTSDMTVTAQYRINTYTLTINYVDAQGGQIAAPVSLTYTYGSNYSITSPAIPGYTADIPVVSGIITGNVTVTVTYTEDAPPVTILLGDVDCNGVVNMADLALAAAFVQNSGQVTAQGILNGDINGDGTLTAADLASLYLLILS